MKKYKTSEKEMHLQRADVGILTCASNLVPRVFRYNTCGWRYKEKRGEGITREPLAKERGPSGIWTQEETVWRLMATKAPLKKTKGISICV